jgi:hypothetical protein
MIPDKHAKLMKIFWGRKCTKQPRNLCALQSLFSCLRNTLLHLKIFVFRVFFMKFNQFCNFLGWVTWRRVECTATWSHTLIIRIRKSRWWGSIEMRKLCSWVWIQNVYSRKLWVDFHCEISMSRLTIPPKFNCYYEFCPGFIIWNDDRVWFFHGLLIRNLYWAFYSIRLMNISIISLIFPLLSIDLKNIISSICKSAGFRNNLKSIWWNWKINWL